MSVPETHGGGHDKGRWSMSIRSKVLGSMILLVVLICSAFIVLLDRQGRQAQEQLVSVKTETAGKMANSLLKQTRAQYSARIRSLVDIQAGETRHRMIQAFADRDRQTLLQLSTPFLEILRKENPYFVSLGWILPDNHVFLRVHDPQRRLEDISDRRPDIAAVNRDRQQHSGFSVSRKAPQLRIVQPVFYQDRYLGAVQMGISAELLIDTLKDQQQLEAGFTIPNEQFEERSGENLSGLVCGTHRIHSTNNQLFRQLIGHVDWDSNEQRVTLQQRRYVLKKILPLNDYENKRLGCLFIAVDINDLLNTRRHSLASAVGLSAALLVVTSLLLYFSFGALIQKIIDLNKSLERANRDLEERVEERTRELTQEVEERKTAEDKLHRAEKMEAIGMMASGVAHDLNNILSGVVSYPELLLMRLPEDSKLRPALVSVKESGLRAAAVVADLLTVARDAAQVRTRANLNALVREYMQSSEAQTLRRNYPHISIETDLETDLPEICCSPTHINKCLMNLVLNAAEACADSGTIRIQTVRQPMAGASTTDAEPGGMVLLTVEDDGPGISFEDQKHIFEPFYTKKKMGRSGTGIGLAVVWNCMQDHGGTVAVASDGRHGSRFTLAFPESADGECRTVPQAPGENTPGQGESILVVDDEPDQREIARQILEQLNYRVATVPSGEQAINYVQEQPVDLLVLDMLMEPGIDGCRTYAEILKLYPDQRAVIVSGYAEAEQTQQALSLGAGDYLVKPYTVEQLSASVHRVLRGS